MLAIGNGELDGNPDVGGSAVCPVCKETHTVSYGTSRSRLPDGTWTEPVESKSLGFVKCPKNDMAYLVSLEGKLLDLPKSSAAFIGCCSDCD